MVYLRVRPENRDNVGDSDIIGVLPQAIANDPQVSYLKLACDSDMSYGSISNGVDDDGSVNVHVWPAKGVTSLRYDGGAGIYIARKPKSN